MLSEEQTRHIYETNSFIVDKEQTTNIDDILETLNHFVAFDYMLTIAMEKLNENHIKTLHKIIKSNTSDARKSWFNVGDYKLKPNVVGGKKTTAPKDVKKEMKRLLDSYNNITNITFENIVDFHYEFEKIHAFQDGNGRVGRLIMFKQCLKEGIVPFVIEDKNKAFYYRGLSRYEKEKGWLIDTCLLSQDIYKGHLDLWDIRY